VKNVEALPLQSLYRYLYPVYKSYFWESNNNNNCKPAWPPLGDHW